MKINELLYTTPEMTEEKLLDLIEEYKYMLTSAHLDERLIELYYKRHETPIDNFAKVILDEYDTIQEKKSYLTKSQRDLICGFVSMCLIKMTKGKEKNEL